LFYKFWFVDVNINGFDRTYVDMAPSRRMASTTNNISADSYEELVDAIRRYTEQEKFAGGFTLDFSVGKSLRLKSGNLLNINCQLKNILNNTNLKTGGYEWAGRQDTDKFRNKYWYAQGFNFFLNVGLKF